MNWMEINNDSFLHILVSAILFSTIWLLILYFSNHITAAVGVSTLDKLNRLYKCLLLSKDILTLGELRIDSLG